jgi:FixJ family two-component response regulator
LLQIAIRREDTTVTAAACVVHVIDDDASWRKSTGRLVSAAGYRVALYESSEAFLQTAKFDFPGCILLDLRMPGLSGLQLQQQLAEIRHTLPIVFVSGHGDIPISVLAMKSGAEDFLTKPVDTDTLLRAVAKAVARNREDRVKDGQLEAWRTRVSALTPTERKVFDLVVRGKLNKQIASDLGTVERTVKWHRHNLMQKLQIDSLAELVSIAERLGLIGPRAPSDPESE